MLSPIDVCLLFSMPGPWEFVVIFFVIFLLFGAKQLPEIAKGMGQAIREFKKSLSEPEQSSQKDPQKKLD